MWAKLLWGWGPGPSQLSSQPAPPAAAVFSEHEVECALQMAAQSLALKNRAIDALHDQLEAAAARLAAVEERAGDAASLVDTASHNNPVGAAEAARAAEVACLLLRCQSAEQRTAKLEAELTEAQTLTCRRAREVQAAHERSAAVKRQLAAVKAELAEAKAAQGSAVTTLAELEAALAGLREDSTNVRREKEEVGSRLWWVLPVEWRVQCMPGLSLPPSSLCITALLSLPVRLLQLQAMLTARESAYLTLLETVQVGRPCTPERRLRERYPATPAAACLFLSSAASR